MLKKSPWRLRATLTTQAFPIEQQYNITWSSQKRHRICMSLIHQIALHLHSRAYAEHPPT